MQTLEMRDTCSSRHTKPHFTGGTKKDPAAVEQELKTFKRGKRDAEIHFYYSGFNLSVTVSLRFLYLQGQDSLSVVKVEQ